MNPRYYSLGGILKKEEKTCTVCHGEGVLYRMKLVGMLGANPMYSCGHCKSTGIEPKIKEDTCPKSI